MILTGRARERYVARAVPRAVLNARLRALSAGRPVSLHPPDDDDRSGLRGDVRRRG